jgi:hypothetical protein
LHGYLDVDSSRNRSHDLQRIKKTVGAINRFDGSMRDRTLRLSAICMPIHYCAMQLRGATGIAMARILLKPPAKCPEFRSAAIHPPGLIYT